MSGVVAQACGPVELPPALTSSQGGDEKRSGRPVARPPAPRYWVSLRDQFIELATLLSTLLTLPPTVPMAVMAATEISEAISTYSMAVAPSWFFINLRKMDSIENLLKKLF